MVELYIDKHVTSLGPQYALYEDGKGDHPMMLSPFQLTRFMKRALKLITKDMKKFILRDEK